MAPQIENFRIQQYADNIQLLSQQKTSRLESLVSGNTYQGERASPVNFIGSLSMRQQEGRAEDKAYDDPPVGRRWISPDNLYYHAILIETQDQVESLSAIEGGIAQAQVAAAMRQKDDVLIRAVFGTAYTGKNGTNPVSFPASQVVAANVGGAAAVGLNYDKFVADTSLFIGNEVDLDAEPLNTVIGTYQHSNLLKQVEAIQEKYKVSATIKNGRIIEFAGHNIIVSNRLPKDSNGYRRCFTFTKGGLHLGTWKALSGGVKKNTVKVGEPNEAYADMMIGGVRIDELRVAEIKCSEP